MIQRRIAVITGGANGIGLSIVRALAREKVFIIVIDRVKMDTAIFAPFSDTVDYYQCDLSNELSLMKTLKLIQAKYHQIDFLVNNAALQYIEPLETLDISHFDEVLATNFKAPVILTKELSPLLVKGGKIINISSVHGEIPRLNKYAYDASKAALNIFTKECALALAKRDITANVVSCGAINTPMNDSFKNAELLASTVKNIPLRRVGEPDEIAEIVCFLLLKVPYITGQVITVDGGRSIFNS